MQLYSYNYDLHLKHPFGVSGFTRKGTPVVLVEITYQGLTGYGEAALPPYLGESQESVHRFFKKIDLSPFRSPEELPEILSYIDGIAPYNHAAKASVDIALHDLLGKIKGKPLHELWELSTENTPYTSYTLGIDTPEILRQKTQEAANYKILKVKLGSNHDREIIKTIRQMTDKPLRVDANQGWKDKHEALDMIHWLQEQQVSLIEQPMPKDRIDDTAWLTQHSPLPIIADEAVQRLDDMKRLKGAYNGINIKLMKSTGLGEARKMISEAQKQNLKIMLGCMTETSCAISAAAQLMSLADWVDLDGNLLIKNDAFEGVKMQDGKQILNKLPGIGVQKKPGLTR